MSETDSSGAVEYRPIPGFPGYFAGDDGSIWTSVIRTGRRGGFKYGDKPHRKLKTRPQKPTKRYPYVKPYRMVAIRGAEKQVRRMVHVLVLTTFSGPPPEGMECRHKDGSADNNRITNLEWATKIVNWEDKRKHGTAPIGEKSGAAKLTDANVIEMRRLRQSTGMQYKDIGAQFGVSGSTASGAITGRYWKHLPLDQS